MELSGVPYSQYSIADTTIHHRFKPLRRLLRGGSPHTSIDVGLFRRTDVSKRFLSSALDNTSNKYLTAHAGYSEKLAELLIQKGCIPIIVVRHPLAIIDSHLRYFPKRPDIFYGRHIANLPEEERLRTILEGDAAAKIYPYAEALRRFVGWADRFPQSIIRFEDVVGSKGGGSDGKQLDTIQRILDATSTRVSAKLIAQDLYGGTKTFDKGKIDSYTNNSTIQSQLDEIRAASELYCNAFGYTV